MAEQELTPFGKWLPDYGPAVQGLVECLNLIPYNGKYFPLNSLTSLVSQTITDSTPLRVYTGKATNEVNKTFVCTQNNIWRLDGTSLANVSTSGGYTTSLGKGWSFDVYGDTVFLTDGASPIQACTSFDQGGSVFSALGGSPPLARYVCSYHDHLFLGYDIESGTPNPTRVFRSAIGDPGTWTITPTNGAGYQDLESWGEEIICLKQIDDQLLAYLNNSIWMIFDVGAPLWFAYTKIFKGNGPISEGCVVSDADNHRHYFLGWDDVYEVFGNVVTPLGAGIRSQTHTINTAYKNNITSIYDQTKKIIYWSYPSVSSSNGQPDTMLIYNIEENRFTHANLGAYCIGMGFTTATTISGMSSYGDIAQQLWPFNSWFWVQGYKTYLAVDPLTNTLSFFGGTPLNSTITTGQIDMGQVCTINRIRPSIYGPSGTVSATMLARLNEQSNFQTTSGTMNNQGLINMRATGRFVELTLNVTGSHQGITGFYPDVVERGKR
jgi:hypothetical protein